MHNPNTLKPAIALQERLVFRDHREGVQLIETRDNAEDDLVVAVLPADTSGPQLQAIALLLGYELHNICGR